ncbi:hypothetical protein [Microbacterium sp.]|uniref:hypothetical protein n=1 Tax=unclassified Microbacterium TaxID=2609290 RepID=UPI001AC14703|nr:hypothetical protein [Microbacterium sp.]MBN9176389.1 hypothetical protein [Microbacterium sp.]
MIRSARADRAIATRVRWTVARLLVGLGLVLVLLTCSWAATHSETEGPQGASISELIITDEPGAVPAVTSGGHAGGAGDLGAALCLLGVACALTLVVLAWRAPSRPYSIERVAGMVRELIAVPPSRMPVLTLTQLRVYRT